jgi:hypothetical protein
MDASFMRNFHLHLLAHILNHPMVIDVLLARGYFATFTSQLAITAHEVIDLDQPITLQNYTSMVHTCMQEGSSTWVA